MNKKMFSLRIFLLLFSVLFSTAFSQSEKVFRNPILSGFYPDPSICKVGDDYYLINSTFGYFPGIPVFHSKDLVNWNLLGHVLDRPEQLNLEGVGLTRGLFAPAIEHSNGKFFVVCTLIDGGGNFVVTADKPEGPWSNLVWLPEVNGIDPSLFFDDDGKTYLLFNSDAPDNKPLYNGHRTIRIREFDPINLKVSNEEKIIVNGGVDLSKKPVWIEGPHIYKVDGKYFLTAAEGGTAEDHSQVIFRSDNVFGPFIPYEKNPILTQRHLKPDRKNPVTCTGHADFVQNEKGDWWTVFLACRPHEPFIENNYNTGRETFLAPITWVDGWPVINYGFEEVQHYYPLPTNVKGKAKIPFSGDFTIKENFDASVLPNYFMFIKTPTENWYNLSSRKGFLEIKLRPETVSGKRNPSFIARRQQHSYCSFSTVMEFDAASENEKAGIIAFQMEEYFYYFCKSKIAGKDVLQLYKSNKDQMVYNMELLYQIEIDESKNLYLKIDASGNEYSFYYAFDKNDWKLFQNKVDASYLSPRNVYGFVGTVFGMYATSLGKQSRNKVYFDWLEYSGMDKLTN
ncbi:MAG: Alpha-N-arabinofuranosidase [Ignavibacteria bacterium]|nr:MAG: Alpha-N-arabinofuranosidase [Ignavibacteria bacterium]KAF0160863.1 MAG: Alpha-N-arabinofuranosidase [Ignavibacteria bacterium]